MEDKGVAEDSSTGSGNVSVSESHLEVIVTARRRPEGWVYSCLFCPRTFGNPQALGGHQNRHRCERRTQRRAFRPRRKARAPREQLDSSSSGPTPATVLQWPAPSAVGICRGPEPTLGFECGHGGEPLEHGAMALGLEMARGGQGLTRNFFTQFPERVGSKGRPLHEENPWMGMGNAGGKSAASKTCAVFPNVDNNDVGEDYEPKVNFDKLDLSLRL